MDTKTQRQADEDAERQAKEAREAEEREVRRQEDLRRNQAILALLEEWDQGDPEEQRQTWEIIERGLREHPFTLRTYEP